MSFFLEGCKVLALRAWFGAGINTAKFQEVFIFYGVFVRQVIDNRCFLQEFKAFCDRAFDFYLAKLYLHGRADGRENKAIGYCTSLFLHIVFFNDYRKELPVIFSWFLIW